MYTGHLGSVPKKGDVVLNMRPGLGHPLPQALADICNAPSVPTIIGCTLYNASNV